MKILTAILIIAAGVAYIKYPEQQTVIIVLLMIAEVMTLAQGVSLYPISPDYLLPAGSSTSPGTIYREGLTTAEAEELERLNIIYRQAPQLLTNDMRARRIELISFANIE